MQVPAQTTPRFSLIDNEISWFGTFLLCLISTLTPEDCSVCQPQTHSVHRPPVPPPKALLFIFIFLSPPPPKFLSATDSVGMLKTHGVLTVYSQRLLGWWICVCRSPRSAPLRRAPSWAVRTPRSGSPAPHSSSAPCSHFCAAAGAALMTLWPHDALFGRRRWWWWGEKTPVVILCLQKRSAAKCRHLASNATLP